MTAYVSGLSKYQSLTDPVSERVRRKKKRYLQCSNTHQLFPLNTSQRHQKLHVCLTMVSVDVDHHVYLL